MEKVPKHIGIILDGNRRFAKKLMLKPWMGHEWGAKKVHALLEWAKELGIKEVTFYALSIQNFDRPKNEFDYLMNLFKNEFDTLMQPEKQKELKQNGLRINFIGRLWMLPKDVQEKIKKLMELTANNKPNIVNFAMAYGGREEVIDAVKKIAEKVKAGTLDIDQINEESFGNYLWLKSEPDLVIRTGGEKRTSNFLLWQGHYAEFFFLDKTWPEMEKNDLVQAVQEYCDRERRFGK